VFWFTIEYGLCKEDGKQKAYGAGLLSSFGELKYCLGGDDEKPEVQPFNVFEAAKQEIFITTYQPMYYLAESFEDAIHQVHEFAKTVPRPFTIHYNQITKSVNVTKDVAVQSKPDCQEVEVQTHGEASGVEATNFIRGVEVIGETHFTVPNKGGSFEWKGYGVRLGVPKNSIPASMAECTINIKASLSGEFKFPEDSDLLSPVFWISAPCQFLKPVTLEIQHCALTEDETFISDLKFVSARCSQKFLPYTFRPIDDGVFTIHSSYASIELTHFSGLAVTGKKSTQRSYCAHIYYSSEGILNWTFYFIITRHLDIQITAVREHYGRIASYYHDMNVMFEDSEITLDIPADGKTTQDGWEIAPRSYPTISRKDADKFVPGPGQWIPKCGLDVEWTKELEQPTHLRHKVLLKGAKAPWNFVKLNLNPTLEDRGLRKQTRKRKQEDHHHTGKSKRKKPSVTPEIQAGLREQTRKRKQDQHHTGILTLLRKLSSSFAMTITMPCMEVHCTHNYDCTMPSSSDLSHMISPTT